MMSLGANSRSLGHAYVFVFLLVDECSSDSNLGTLPSLHTVFVDSEKHQTLQGHVKNH
jgi:hypothetical protein